MEMIERIINDDGKTINFEISALINQNIFPLKAVVNNGLSFKYKNREVNFLVKQHNIPFQHTPCFAAQSAAFDFNIRLLEIIYSFPIDYDFFIKKLYRYGSRINEETLVQHPHWESIAISTVLRHISVETINKFIDSYRIITTSVQVPPITENSIIHISYQAKNDKGIHVIEDTKIGIKKIDDDSSSEIIPLLEAYMAIPNNELGFVLNIFNSVALLEAGYYPQSLASVIDGFHSYIDYLINKFLTAKTLKEKIANTPWDFNASDKTTWIFEIIFNFTLKDFLYDISRGDLYEKYIKYREARNKIAHPDPVQQKEISLSECHEACHTVLNTIFFIRKKIEGTENYNDILHSLEMHLYKRLENT